MIKKTILLILFAFTSACAADQTGEGLPTVTLSPSSEPTALPLSTPTPSITPSLTPTSSPTLPPPTATPAPVERISFTVMDTTTGFARESTFWLVNSDGTDIESIILQDEQFYGSRGHLAWSHDGRYLAFDGGDTVTCDGVATECYSINYGTFVTDITQKRILYHIEDTFANTSWSPDSQQLVLSIHNEMDAGENPTVDDLYILDVNSGGLKQLTSSPSNDLYPSWSPDGQWIAFVRFAPPASGCPSFPSTSHSDEKCSQASLFRIRPDGSDLQLLHESIFIYEVINLGANVNNAPTWSPDSRLLAFLTRNEKGLPDHSNITIVNVETGEWQLAGVGSRTTISPAWSPDGKKLAFASNRDGGDFDIYILDLNEDGIVNLTQTDITDFPPIWSMSGTHIAFISRNNLVIMNADGTNKVIIDKEDNGMVLGIPAWLPGGQP